MTQSGGCCLHSIGSGRGFGVLHWRLMVVREMRYREREDDKDRDGGAEGFRALQTEMRKKGRLSEIKGRGLGHMIGTQGG